MTFRRDYSLMVVRKIESPGDPDYRYSVMFDMSFPEALQGHWLLRDTAGSPISYTVTRDEYASLQIGDLIHVRMEHNDAPTTP